MINTRAWITFDIFWTTESEDARAKFYAQNPSSFDDGAANDLVSSATTGKIYPMLANYEGSRKGSDGGICVSIPEEHIQEWQEAATKEGAYLQRITRETAENLSEEDATEGRFDDGSSRVFLRPAGDLIEVSLYRFDE